MSEQTTTTNTASTDEKLADDSEPSTERQAELRAAYETNMKLGKPPYAGVVIRTRGEMNWMIQERGWLTRTLETIDQCIDLRRVGLQDAVLSDFDLFQA